VNDPASNAVSRKPSICSEQGYRPNGAFEINILTQFERFAFSILPCELDEALGAIRKQGQQWQKSFAVDRPCRRDARMICCSPDGPNRLPAIEVGILLSEVNGNQGRRTLFISNVADGYRSMIFSVSRSIPGVHLMFCVCRSDLEYPGNFMEAAAGGEFVRTIYSLRDSNGGSSLRKAPRLRSRS
jgi:hypothetical protein